MNKKTPKEKPNNHNNLKLLAKRSQLIIEPTYKYPKEKYISSNDGSSICKKDEGKTSESS